MSSFEVKNNITLMVTVCFASFEAIGELQKEKLCQSQTLQANHLNNNENLPSLEVSPPISSNFQRIASTCTSAIVAYSDFTVNLYNYFLSKAGLFLTKISLTTNL